MFYFTEIKDEKNEKGEDIVTDKSVIIFLVTCFLLVISFIIIGYNGIKEIKKLKLEEQQQALKEQQKRYDVEVIYKDKAREKYTNIKKYYSRNNYITLVLPNDKEVEIHNADIKIIEK